MLILMSAALAAAATAVPPAAGEDTHSQHQAMAYEGRGQMKCCECCKDMASEHERHTGHPGLQAH